MSIDEIQERIDSRKARVFTASEYKAMLREGRVLTAEDVDVVTCGTLGVMSGTMAVMTIPVAPAGTFRKADTITLNGVPGTVGPCPNESLGMVDCIVYGTSKRDMSYGGGHLFRDLVAGENVEVRVTSDGDEYRSTVRLCEIPFARMILTRGAFRNYTCFANRSDSHAETIFSGPEPMAPNLGGASVSGCGEINPVENDPDLDYLRPGASVMLNGAPGIVIGTGTRSSPEKPNLSIAADMHLMRADLMGGFRTSSGPECLTSVGAVIPMTGTKALRNAGVVDGDIVLPVADVSDRKPLSRDRYSSVWTGTDLEVSCDLSKCLHCNMCEADAMCPVDAEPSAGIGECCMSCGLCVSTCPGHVFDACLGDVNFCGTRVPIVLRQSSRAKAELLCSELKTRILSGNWNLRCNRWESTN